MSYDSNYSDLLRVSVACDGERKYCDNYELSYENCYHEHSRISIMKLNGGEKSINSIFLVCV